MSRESFRVVDLCQKCYRVVVVSQESIRMVVVGQLELLGGYNESEVLKVDCSESGEF